MDMPTKTVQDAGKKPVRHRQPPIGLVVAAFLSSFTSLGLAFSYSVFQDYYQSTSFPTEPSPLVALVGGLQTFMIFAGGSTPVPASWSPSYVMTGGVTLCLVSWAWLDFARSFVEVLLSQGVLFGAGSSMLYHPAQQLVDHSSGLRRGFCAAFASSGSLYGGLFWTIVTRHLLNTVGAHWTFRIVAGVSLVLSASSCVAIHISCGQASKYYPSQSRARTSSKPSIARQLLLSLSLLCVFTGLSGVLTYAVSFGVDHGLDSATANYVLSTFFFSSLIGLAISSWLEPYISSIYSHAVTAALAGLVTVAHPIMISPATNFVYFAIMGLVTGGLLAKVPSISRDYISGVTWWAANSPYFGFLLGGPLCGLLLQAGDGGWFGAAFFSSGALLFGALVLVFVGGYWYPADEADEAAPDIAHCT